MGIRIKKELVYEYWDCLQCDAKGLLGSVESCPQCSKARDKSVRFYRKEDQEVLVTPEAAHRHQGGADWICEYCNGLNSSSKTHCGSCTAEKSAHAKTVLTEGRLSSSAKPTPSQENTSKNSAPKAPPPKSRRWALLGIAVAMAATVIYWSMAEENNSYKVDGVNWIRKIHVERYVRDMSESWENETSGEDVSILEKTRKIRSYRDVLDHYKKESYTDTESYQSGSQEKCSTQYQSAGNGAAEKTTVCQDEPVYSTRNVTKTREVPVYRKEPIFDQWIRYQSSLYKEHKVFEMSGNTNIATWPKVSLATGFQGKPDREGAKLETYMVTLRRLSQSKKAPPKVSITTTAQRFVEHYRLGQEISVGYQNLGGLQWPQGDLEENKDQP